MSVAHDYLPEWVGQRARLTPDRLAVMSGNIRYTFSGLDADVGQLTAVLGDLGIGPDDRIAVLMGNGYGMVLVIHALVRIGATLVPLNTRLTAGDLAWQVANARAGFLLHDQSTAQTSRAILHLNPSLQLGEISRDFESTSPRGPGTSVGPGKVQRIDLNTIQSIIYTSGTTGRPKGAQITLGNLWWSAIGSALNLGHQIDDRWLVCLPLFHIGGMSILFRSVIYGITAIVHECFDAAAVNRAIDDDQVTIVSVVSTTLQRMLDARGSRAYPPTLRCVLLGGGPASERLLTECAARKLPVVQTYGLTEAASQVATLPPEDALRKLGSAGKPLFSTDLRVVLHDQLAKAGEVGEIQVSGPTVTTGYVDNPAATAATIRDGWLRTGDLGYLDAEGFLYVVDRRDDLVVTGGENVYPAEVEKVLREHPAVAEAVVVGLADDRWGQRVAVAILLGPGTPPNGADILAFCRSRLAGYKVPTRLRFVDEIPRNASGKILRHVLRESWPTGADERSSIN